MRQFSSVMKNRFLLIAFFATLLVIIASGNQRQLISTDNMNRTKSLEAIHIVNKYNNILEGNKPLHVGTIEEVSQNGALSPVSFTGTLTGYGPDCEGCGGRVGCPPRQDVTDGNIYFEDSEYGTIRIVATDPSIPCGTIVKISNLSFSSEPIIAIALDRGSDIQGLTMDLLFESEAVTKPIGREYNVGYEIIRWGW